MIVCYLEIGDTRMTPRELFRRGRRCARAYVNLTWSIALVDTIFNNLKSYPAFQLGWKFQMSLS